MNKISKTNTKTTDLRLIKNKNSIQKAFLDLLAEKSFADINVSEIIKRALLSRGTFYAHYSDKYSLLYEYLYNQLEIELQSIPNSIPLSSGDTLRKNINFILSHFQKYSELYQELINSRNISVYSSEIFESIINNTEDQINIILNEKEIPANIDVKLLSKFYSYAYIDIGLDWIENGMDTPINELTEKLSNITIFSLNI